MNRSKSFQRLALISIVAFMFSSACRAPFEVRVTDFRGGSRPAFYEGEALKMNVQWDKEDRDSTVSCQVVDTYTGETKWRGLAMVPTVENGSLNTLSFDPPLPEDGQLGLTAGGYEWVCDLGDYARSGIYFDIIER